MRRATVIASAGLSSTAANLPYFNRPPLFGHSENDTSLIPGARRRSRVLRIWPGGRSEGRFLPEPAAAYYLLYQLEKYSPAVEDVAELREAVQNELPNLNNTVRERGQSLFI